MKKTRAEEVMPPSSDRHRTGRVRFFAIRDRVRAALDEGHSLIVIYEQHQTGLKISYSQFARYVTQFLTQPVPDHYPWGRTLKRRDDRNRPALDANGEKTTGQPRFNFRRDKSRDSLI
jgi:Family of unknown function (DUF5338)